MSSNPLVQLTSFGQSVWLDQMERNLTSSGELARLISDDGLRGLTSNPTIFEKAISGSADYQKDIDRLAREGRTGNDIYEALVVDDIAHAADLFRPVYESSGGQDGFVSLEVSPLLAHSTDATIHEAKSLFARVNRPNVMIKVPATKEGLPAIEELIAAGLNINVTLIFSVQRYEEVTEAYLRGLERRAQSGLPVDKIGSVASFFVSRIDSAVDKELDRLEKGAPDGISKESIHSLRGKAAIANAKLAYASFQRIFGSPRFEALKRKGARVQRPLWASTSTKDPSYSDVLYVETLIGPDTVNTMPPATIKAYRDHGKPALTLGNDLEGAKKLFEQLAELGINFAAITDKLTSDGVQSFAQSFNDLMRTIENRRELSLPGLVERHAMQLGTNQGAFDAALQQLESKKVVERIWRKDAAVWSTDPAHQKIINNSLGWLSVANMVAEHTKELKDFAKEIAAAGFQKAVVLGMGGSSLCPEVLRRTFGKQAGFPELLVLDSTVPGAVLDIDRQIDPNTTLFIVASKSGSTTEPQMFYRYYFDRVRQLKGDKAGDNFIAITDPNTQLEGEAKRDKFRRIFLNPADIGGRFSALSFFGMVPFAIMGGDVDALLARAKRAMESCAASTPLASNAGARLGATLGSLALRGRDKVTLVITEPLDTLGLWIEQLVAESTGKNGKGIVPIAGEALAEAKEYSDDRVFVYIGISGGRAAGVDVKLQALEQAGHPVLRHVLNHPLDLGEELYLWEFATAVAGALMDLNPFDQPNVQESKDNTKRILKEFLETGSIPALPKIGGNGTVQVFADEKNRNALARAGNTVEALLTAHMARVGKGDYVAITQYIAETAEIEALLQELRLAVRSKTSAATTTGYGPRFLHSTGQLHKGGADNGVFVQLMAKDAQDVAIPNEKYGFSVLKEAQALGDFESLSARGRRAIRVDLGADIVAGLKQLLATVKQMESVAP